MHYAVNAKNSYGGYTGQESYEAFFQDGQLRGILQKGKYKDIFGYPTWDVLASMPVSKTSGPSARDADRIEQLRK